MNQQTKDYYISNEQLNELTTIKKEIDLSGDLMQDYANFCDDTWTIQEIMFELGTFKQRLTQHYLDIQKFVLLIEEQKI
jgi:hypothetical protein